MLSSVFQGNHLIYIFNKLLEKLIKFGEIDIYSEQQLIFDSSTHISVSSQDSWMVNIIGHIMSETSNDILSNCEQNLI